jgi:DNA-binding MarR family transcriptional regulator
MYNISGFHSGVLFYIQALGEKATPGEISRWLFREAHSVSEIVTQLVKEGMVRKVKDLDRKNMIRVELTEKGREAYYHVVKRESIHRIMSSLSKEQQRQLWIMLKTLRDESLKEIGVQREWPCNPFKG